MHVANLHLQHTSVPLAAIATLKKTNCHKVYEWIYKWQATLLEAT